MKKKYLLWGYAVIAICILVVLCTIAFSSLMGMKGVRNHMANPENRKTIYETAAKVTRDTGLQFPDFRIEQHKPGEFQNGGFFRDTLVVFFYKGISDNVFKSFEEKAKSIAENNDSTKSVEIDSLNYHYQDFYINGFSCYIGIKISKDSKYGEIIYGNWKQAKE